MSRRLPQGSYELTAKAFVKDYGMEISAAELLRRAKAIQAEDQPGIPWRILVGYERTAYFEKVMMQEAQRIANES